MVGFGSSLRMSRRRGWEDAYLDYASLRLLLIQIEAVYEEEDWKLRSANNDENDEDDDKGVNKFWRWMSRKRKRRQQRTRRWESMDEDDNGSNWVVATSSSPRRDKKDKANHALEKRGWRPPGVQDYRDELFLVSDDDIAFGWDEDEEEEQEDEWDDTDADDDDEEKLYDYERIRVDSSSSDIDNVNFDQTTDGDNQDLRLLPLKEEQMSHSGVSVNPEDLADEDYDQLHTSPDAIEESHVPSEGLDITQLDHPQTPVESDKVTVQTRYETFASVAARKGVTDTQITSGSPEQSWLDFIPGFIANKAKNQKEPNERLSGRETKCKTSPALGFAESLTPSNSHHSPASSESDQFLSGSKLKFRYDDQQHSPLFISPEPNDPMTPNAMYKSHFKYKPATATALGASMPTTPLSLSPVVEKTKMSRKQSTDGSGFGISLNSSLIPTSEMTGLLTSSSSFKAHYGQQSQQSMTPTRDNRKTVSQYQFYSFQDNHEQSEEQAETEDQRNGLDMKRNQNMFSYYNDGYFSVRSQQTQQRDDTTHLRMPSLSTAPSHEMKSQGNFIVNFLLGKAEEPTIAHHNNKKKASSRLKRKASIKRDRERMRRRKRLQRRNELVSDNLRAAHVRASAITERFRGLLQAEVEKIILFANSRLGELSDTIGSLRYSSYEDGNQEFRRSFPNLDDGGIHPCSSSDDDEGDDVSYLSSDDENRKRQAQYDQTDEDHKKQHKRYSSNEKDAATKRQLVYRDRLRVSRPLFMKAGFLGEDFSLLSAVDETDAFTAIGVELMHLLKFVCVNIIAVRKICKKHDRLLSNRMLGDYYHNQMKKVFHSNTRHNVQAPELGLLLSKPANLESTGGYTLGIFDTKIQEIANSTTMATVSSTLAVALAEAEASQSRSMQLMLNNELGATLDRKSTLDEAETPSTPEIPSPKHSPFTSKRLRDAVSYQIGGHCFRVDDDSSQATAEQTEEDENARDVSLTRLQYVVTSVFGLREAARNRSTLFEDHASRIFMTSTGPNILGDGLTGCARETLDFLCSYNPDKAYLLDIESMYASLKVGKEKAMGLIMASTLTAAANKDASSLAIRRSAAGNQEGFSVSDNSWRQRILGLNTVSTVLFIVNYYAIMPSAYMFSLELGTRSSQGLLLAASNISSVLTCVVHAMLLSKRHSFVKSHIIDLSFFRLPLMLSALLSIVGNILYSYSMSKQSFKLALLGRFLFGFGSCELLNRDLLRVAMPNDSINGQVALLVKRSLMATPVGLLFGSLFDLRVKDEVVHFLDPAGVRTIHLGAIMQNSTVQNMQSSWQLPSTISLATNTPAAALDSSVSPNLSVSNLLPETINNYTANSGDIYLPPLPLPSNSLQVHLPFGEHRVISVGNVGYMLAVLWGLQLIGLLFFYDVPERAVLEGQMQRENQTFTEQTDEDEDIDTFDDSDDNVFANDNAAMDSSSHGDETLDGTFEKLQTMSRRSVRHDSKHSFVESVKNVFQLVLSNVAFPTTSVMLFLSKAAIEVLLCSGGTIMNRYFAWSGALAGLFMGAVATTTLPVNVLLSKEANIVERKVIKGALKAAEIGICVMLNYEAIFLLIRGIIKNEKKWIMPAIYDDLFGLLQYIVGFCILFVSASFIESSSLTLMSKVSPSHLRRYSIDNSFVVIVLSLLGRFMGDLLISAVDVSSWVFCSDIINSLLLPLLIGFVAANYLVRKHYFFLI